MAKHHETGRDCFVYWLYDHHVISRSPKNKPSPKRHGYVGCTSTHQHMLRTMNRLGHRTCFTAILFRGTQEECLAFEKKLRPFPNIGWNKGIGGTPDGRGLRG